MEIGCGWAALLSTQPLRGRACARRHLSREQLCPLPRNGSPGQGLKLVQLELRDYRDIQGSYGHIVSIEMLEAVGERYLAPFSVI